MQDPDQQRTVGWQSVGGDAETHGLEPIPRFRGMTLFLDNAESVLDSMPAPTLENWSICDDRWSRSA